MGWIMRVWALVTATVLLGISGASGAWAEEVSRPVDLELVLAVDASGSISTGALEFQLRVR